MVMLPGNKRPTYLNAILDASHYTQDEIMEILSQCRNSWEYDYAIERLYLLRGIDTRKECKNRLEYSYVTARQMVDRRRQEVSWESVSQEK